MEKIAAYFHGFFNPAQVKDDFRELKSLGVKGIFYPLLETEADRFPKDLRRGFDLAHQLGLKVYVTWASFGGAFASPALTPSRFTSQHPETRMIHVDGKPLFPSCINQPTFKKWFFETTETLVKTLPVDGVLFDEPDARSVCYCEICRKLAEDNDLVSLRSSSVIKFLSQASRKYKKIKSDFLNMIVVLPDTCQKTNFSKLARIPSIDVFGTDPYWLILRKDLGFVREYAQLIKEVTKKSGKRSQLWIQNFFVPKNKEKELEEAFEIIIDAKPDQFCFFYYWRNNDDPERIWKITRKYLKQI